MPIELCAPIVTAIDASYFRDLLQCPGVGHVAETHSAVLLGNDQPKHSELLELAEEVRRKLTRNVPLPEVLGARAEQTLERTRDVPSVSFCASETVGKGKMTSCSMRPMHRDRMKLVVSLSATGRSFFEGGPIMHALQSARPWAPRVVGPLGNASGPRVPPLTGRQSRRGLSSGGSSINEKGTVRCAQDGPLGTLGECERWVTRRALPPAPRSMRLSTAESDLFLFFPRTPQNAVPAPRRQAKPVSDVPPPKRMPGPRSKKNQGATFSLAMISTPMRMRMGTSPVLPPVWKYPPIGKNPPVTTVTRS